MYAHISGAAMGFNADGAYLPVLSEVLNIPAENASVSLQKTGVQRIPVENYLLADRPVTTPIANEVKYLGLYREAPLSALNIIPVEFDQVSSEVVWYENIIVTVRFNALERYTRSESLNGLNSGVSKGILNASGGMYLLKNNNNAALQNVNLNNLPDLFSRIYKIVVQENGIYKITYDDLLDLQFPVNDINPQNLALFNKGREVALFVQGAEDGRFDSNDFIEFWGERNERTFIDKFPDMYNDPFSDKNVYWLVDKGRQGRRMVEESGGIVETQPNRYIVPFAFKETLHFEKDTHRELFGHDPEKLNQPSHEFDHWFWGNVINAVESRSFEFELPHPLEFGSSVFVTAMMRGASIRNNATNPIEGHQVAVWLNEEKVGEITPEMKWQGQTKATVSNIGSAGLSQLNLNDGTNILRVDMEQTGVTDIVLLNWFDITYQRKYRAADDFIKFRLQEGIPTTDRIIQFEVDGFESKDVDVYKLGVSKVVNGQIKYFTDDNRFSSYQISFQDQIFDPSVEYVAVSEQSKKKPLSISEYKPWKDSARERRLSSTANSSDLIIITADLFKEQVGRLKTLKEQQGFTVEVVTVEHIYDIFNHGIKSPLAIKKFLQYAYQNWDDSKALQYAILVGDGSWDYKGRINGSNDLVPPIMFTTVTYGAAPSDLQYALLSGDDLIPDITVGRIPATNSVELENYLDKVESYQNGDVPIDGWRNSTLFISGFDAGAGDREDFTNEPIFRAQNNRLVDLKLPKDIFAYKLNTQKNPALENDPDFGSTRELLDYMDDGVSFINFFGHGGGAVWADEQLFILSDVANLNNTNKYPFVSSMTCFTGAFENPNKEGLAERLLTEEEKGAIAVLASSSVGWAYNDFSIQWGLYDYLWQEDVSFGQAVDFMKISYLMNPIYYTQDGSSFTRGYFLLKNSMVNQYNLLGDPTLVLQKPQSTISVKASNVSPAAGENITLTVQSSFNNAAGRLEISDERNTKYLQENIVINNGSATVNFNVPDSIAGSRLDVKAYVSSGSDDAHGHIKLAFGRTAILSVKNFPENPAVGDSIRFEVVVQQPHTIQSMQLRKFRSYNSLAGGNYSLPMQAVNDTLFSSQGVYGGFNNEGLKYFEIYFEDEAGEHRFDLQKITIKDDRPDFAVEGQSLTYAGNDELQVQVDVANTSSIDAAGVVVSVFDETGITSGVPFYNDTLFLAANSSETVKAPYYAQNLQQFNRFKISVDPADNFVERDESNNEITKTLFTDHIWFDYRVGSASQLGINDTITVFDDWRFYLAPQALSASSVFEFEELNAAIVLQNSKQKDLKYIRPHNQQDSVLLRVDVKNEITGFQSPALLSVQLDTSKYSAFELSAVSFFRFDPFLGLWVKMESSLDGTTLSTQLNSSALYGVFSFRDNNDPVIEITANGRPLRENMLVRATPALALLIQDENGINLGSTFRLKLDGNEVPQSEMTFPDSISNANSISILTTPTFSTGEHVLEVEVSDISNNTTRQTIAFNVVANFDLIVHGNYPNPFADETYVSYDLLADNVIDDLSVRIYTLSGRLIRKQMLDLDETVPDDNIKGVGYHELVWDGTDDDGNQVANGVYFMVLKAKYKGQVITRKLKVARLR